MKRGPVGMIAAVSPEGVIGVGGRIPWRYPADTRRFKRLTEGSTVIMGRRTWESMGGRPLPNRRNLVVTRARLPGVETFPSLEAALDACDGAAWLIGGERIYAEGMKRADFIDLTFVPDHVQAEGAVKFPPIDEREWEPGPLEFFEDDPRLTRRRYTRRRPR